MVTVEPVLVGRSGGRDGVVVDRIISPISNKKLTLVQNRTETSPKPFESRGWGLGTGLILRQLDVGAVAVVVLGSTLNLI